ncbi:MAG: tRNA-2-methylthio-N6-dimethylallyladenosine synthase, partial [Actinomycetota bacterium]|nr:tRNA-2-methylthio-N6-dimethylallyladenosine synthase [Actinomycetota bacterium]
AWDRAEAESCAVPAHGPDSAAEPGRISLGLPTLRVSAAAGTGATSPIYDPLDGQR